MLLRLVIDLQCQVNDRATNFTLNRPLSPNQLDVLALDRCSCTSSNIVEMFSARSPFQALHILINPPLMSLQG